jgi:hypothetical protein
MEVYISLLASLLLATPSDDDNARKAALQAAQAEWSWAKSHFGSLKTYELAETADPPLARLLAWAKPGETLSAYDRTCRGIRLTRQAHDLRGRLLASSHIDRDTKTDLTCEVTFGKRIGLQGNLGVVYKKQDGRWIRQKADADGSVSYGCDENNTVGGVLSRVSEDTAWYSGSLVRFDGPAICDEQKAVDSPCFLEQTCLHCEAWRFSYSYSFSNGLGMGTILLSSGTNQSNTDRSLDCLIPCQPIELPADIERLAQFLQNRTFFHVSEFETLPFLFKNKEACRKYLKQHKLTQDERNPWEH